MKKVAPVLGFLILVLVLSFYDLNNFLSIGISALFLTLNLAGFIIYGNNTFIVFRNIFGLLAVELIVYGTALTALLKSPYILEHPMIDIFGIGTSLMFFVGISIFLFLFFLLLNWVKNGTI
jgi:membrane-bound ClpP family serine protease